MPDPEPAPLPTKSPPLPPLPFQALQVAAWTATCAAGTGREALLAALRSGQSGLRHTEALPAPTSIGQVAGLDAPSLPGHLAAWDCRNNRLAWLALQQDGFLAAAHEVVARLGAHRVAVLMGTSTSSIGASEAAYRALTPEGHFPPDLMRPQVHTLHSLGGFVSAATGAQGPCATVATACSSSAKVFAQAERLIRCGLVDAAIVGGTDSLCDSVRFGFHALGLVSPEPCRPFDARRQGINLAEAAGFALLTRADLPVAHSPQTRDNTETLWLLGHGESSDAHHMSAPHPQGLGARLAMQQALLCAGLQPADIGYLNLHGTATRQNDQVEAAAVGALFPATLQASSTKGWTGHALGAAGIVEAVVCLLALREGWTPGTLNLQDADPDMPAAFHAMLQARTPPAPLRHAMSNAFGFGGNNACLVFGRQPRVEASMAAQPTAAPLELDVLGLGLWTPQWPHWDAARVPPAAQAPATSAPDMAGDTSPQVRPGTTLLPPAERRRAPFTVLIALAAAEQACTMAGLAPSSMPSVFASAHGDTEITDYLCRTLAESPEHLSPTRFHNSVHNAASGYWTIGTACQQASTALSAWQHNLPLGLLEAATQALCAGQPVLLVAYDMAPTGALACVVGDTPSLSLALVLAPAGMSGPDLAAHADPTSRSPARVARIRLSLHAAPRQPANGRHEAIGTAGHVDGAGSPWPLLTALAQAHGGALRSGDARATNEASPPLSWPLSPQLDLHLTFVTPSG